jgi:hypothetical protein
MTFGNVIAILIAAAALYGIYAAVRGKWPFTKRIDKY